MAKSKRRTCRHSGCDEEPYLGGLCRKHHEEDIRKRQRRDAALDVLHRSVIDGRLMEKPGLRDELRQVQRWWSKACLAVQQARTIAPLPFEEAEYAVEWCISLAQFIMDDELAYRAGKEAGYENEFMRKLTWERFHNLEQGLRSNGTQRQRP